MQIEKQWLGESGYCNCLLVTMCRAQISTLNISSAHIVPDLEALAAQRPDTATWIRAQKFQYADIDTPTVINILSKTANISRLPWMKKEGAIQVHDVVGDDGPIVQRVFRLHKQLEHGVTFLRIELEK